MTPPFEQSAALAGIATLRHGFFGRTGGISTGDLSGLNVSLSVGDHPDTVAANRQAVQDAMGLGPLVILKQTHSARVETISGPIPPGSVEADAMVTAASGLALGILTADCTPILLVDAEAGVIGATHAGWRGAVDGIVGNTVAAMVSLGAVPARIRAAYGPTIHGASYEVGEQFKSDFLGLHPAGAHHFHNPDGGLPHFDLPGFIDAQLRAAGIAMVDRVGGCTYAHPERYFSHRFATHRGTPTGRQIAVIGMT